MRVQNVWGDYIYSKSQQVATSYCCIMAYMPKTGMNNLDAEDLITLVEHTFLTKVSEILSNIHSSFFE